MRPLLHLLAHYQNQQQKRFCCECEMCSSLFLCQFWGWNPRLCTCSSSALWLNHIPSPVVAKNETGWRQRLINSNALRWKKAASFTVTQSSSIKPRNCEVGVSSHADMDKADSWMDCHCPSWVGVGQMTREFIQVPSWPYSTLIHSEDILCSFRKVV